MGRSYTCNVIGYSAEQDGRWRLYPAMTKTEMAQIQHIEGRDLWPVEGWQAQTEIGRRMLGDDGYVLDKNIKHVQLTTCRICGGRGSVRRHGCPVCNHSGICRRGNENAWKPWQLDEMRKEFAEEVKA